MGQPGVTALEHHEHHTVGNESEQNQPSTAAIGTVNAPFSRHWQVVDRGSCGVSIGVDGGPFEIDVRFVPDGPKLTKNRLHLDVKPVHRDQAAGLGRLPALGARQVGVGQGAQNWFALAGPKGNEFCLCRP